MFITKCFKLRIENKDAVARVTHVAGLRIGAASLATVAAHEIQDACVNQRMRNRAKRGGVRPGADAGEAVFAQEGCCLRGPIRLAAELRLESGLGARCS